MEFFRLHHNYGGDGAKHCGKRDVKVCVRFCRTCDAGVAEQYSCLQVYLLGVIISFKTNAVFVDDIGIANTKVKKFLPVRSIVPGPIYVWDVKIVGVIE